jgi:KDO2-lipid IV(A) lauroyltransferase
MESPPPGIQCGIDTVELARFERFLDGLSMEERQRLFNAQELVEVGNGPGATASLAARFAAKEACCKLFPRETALGIVGPADFWVRRDAHGAPTIEVSPAAGVVLGRQMVNRVRVSLTHTAASASAIAWSERAVRQPPWFGALMYHLLPLRRGVVLENLRGVFGGASEAEIRHMAQEYYGHFARFLWEFLRLPLMSERKRADWVRVENMDSPIRAHQQGKGLLLLTGHFGNWEVATVAGIRKFPQYRGLFHFVRRPLKPGWLNAYANFRFRRAGFGTLSKRGSLDRILDLLGHGGIIVYVFDQHASGSEGIPVEFCGRPAATFKSLAILAMTTGAPVVPAAGWREADGSHVLRFEDPLPLIECDDTNEAIRLNTRAYNAALERMLFRHPEQWIWMHRRWKRPKDTRKRRAPSASRT